MIYFLSEFEEVIKDVSMKKTERRQLQKQIITESKLPSLQSNPQLTEKVVDGDVVCVDKMASQEVKPHKDIPQSAVDHIRQLLETNKAGIWVSHFLTEYKVI